VAGLKPGIFMGVATTRALQLVHSEWDGETPFEAPDKLALRMV